MTVIFLKILFVVSVNTNWSYDFDADSKSQKGPEAWINQ